VNHSSMIIGELARSAGVGVETVHYYQRLKLLDQPSRPYGSVAATGVTRWNAFSSSSGRSNSVSSCLRFRRCFAWMRSATGTERTT
jgi:hypothetical protein